jgi:hypothetical protein
MDDLLYLGIGTAMFVIALWFVRGGVTAVTDGDARGRDMAPSPKSRDAAGGRP